MRLPKDILSKTYTKPRFFLCETDKQRICQLETINTNGTFKFNAYSEITFEIARIYNNLITGLTTVNPFYDRIEAVRLVEVENFGFFEIQGPGLTSDGIKESKDITAYSLEYTLSHKYLEDFYTVNGRDEWAGSLEDLWQVKTGKTDVVPKIVLYNPDDENASVLHLILEKVYGWSIGHVDASLWSLSRSFDVDRQSVYDFIMNEICAKFNCYVEFDTINNTINFYAESPTKTIIADGETNTFIIDPPFSTIETVSVNGYKTTRWDYKLTIDEETSKTVGVITLEDTPAAGAYVDIIGDMLQKWETDVFITFDNLAQEIQIDYDSESIKTVLTVTYGDDGDIREVNLGLPYLVDLSYYYTPEWMGQDLYDAYTKYLEKTDSYQVNFTDQTKQRLELSGHKNYHEHRLALGYSIASVDSETTGTYYVRGGTEPNYYYTEVTLPAEYKPDAIYYSMKTTNLNEEKMENLFVVLQQFFNGDADWEKELDKLVRDFEFMESPTLSDFKDDLNAAITLDDKDTVVLDFLAVVWEELGRTPLKELYLDAYKTLQSTYMSMEDDKDKDWKGGNWSDPTHHNYWFYYPVPLMIKSIEAAIVKRDETIKEYQDQIDAINKEISNTSNDLLIVNNFTKEQLIRLSAFLREDELKLDDIVETNQDDLNKIYETKQDAMESGRIELKKLCEPQLQFSMNMANIYALPEFEPIVDQFQLGNVIKVGLRPDYIKQSRLLQVDLNFDDFSDFSCSFGDLTSLRTQSDIHADLLKQAVSAGKSVATNASYWTKGSNQATATDLKIQNGLLDATQKICSIDGTQHSFIDKYGLHLQKKNPDTGEIDPKQAWLVNNSLMFTDDNWKTSKAGLGEFTIDGQSFYGLIAEAVIAGYIEGSKIVGGTIQIGESKMNPGHPAFEVDENGNVKMLGGLVEFSENGNNVVNSLAASEERLQTQITESNKTLQNAIDNVNNKQMYDVKVICNGPTSLSYDSDKAILHCKVYAWNTDVTESQDATNFQWHRTSVTTNTFNGDGTTSEFVLTNIGDNYSFGAVFIDDELYANYEDIDKYKYNTLTRKLELIDYIPKQDAVIEIVSDLDYKWDCAHSGVKMITVTHNEINDLANISCKFNLPEEQNKEE